MGDIIFIQVLCAPVLWFKAAVEYQKYYAVYKAIPEDKFLAEAVPYYDTYCRPAYTRTMKFFPLTIVMIWVYIIAIGCIAMAVRSV